MECSDRTQLCVDAKSRDTCFNLFSVHVRESNGKGTVVPLQVTKMYVTVEVQLHSILISMLDRRELSVSGSGRSNFRERLGRTKDEGNATTIKYSWPYTIGRQEAVHEDSTYGLFARIAARVFSLVTTGRLGYTAINE
jgi:hypothetical protein